MKYIFLIIALGALLQYQFTTDTPQADEKVQIHSTAYPASAPAVPEEIPHDQSQARKLVEYAKMFYGVPYRYGSSDPQTGFDCSGFIYHVFTHFDMDVPRSSVDFTHIGRPVEVTQAAPGDLILFTGSDPDTRIVGHIGIVVENDHEGLEFIHSSSGKKYAVTISPLEGYYEERLVKVIRLI